MPRRMTEEELRERFWQRVRVTGRCWEWQGARCIKGYGKLWARGRHYKAHRLAYELAWDDIPPGMQVMHACDNPPCVNPAHLRVGTARDNTHDMIRKGRYVNWQDSTPWPTHCNKGHEFTPENTRPRTDSAGRRCRTCHNERQSARFTERYRTDPAFRGVPASGRP